jgi:DNA-binding SARP family transcriptional activator/WD40 repeat protein
VGVRAVSEPVGLWIRVLGPLQVGVDGRVVPLRGVRQRRLMAALVAMPNRVVSSDRLVDMVWGDTPPDGAGAALAKDVYRVRTALGSVGAAGLVVTQPPGYRLVVDEDRLDAGRFASLVAEGQQILDSDPTRALSVLNEALALWRGPAWAEFAGEDFARPLVSGLDELRALAVECQVDAMLALGRHEEVVSELQHTVASYPLRERPRAQLMRALYLAGRHAEALTVYREFRATLMDELGLEPSAALRALEQDILQQRAELPMSRPRPGQRRQGRAVGLPGFEERFVGRVTELSWLEVLLGRSVPGDRPVVAWLAGEAGAGKTSLAAVFGRIASARGTAVVYARCAAGVPITAQLLEELDAASSSASASAAAPDAPSRQAVLDALDGFGGGRRVLLILDDVDRSADDAVAFLAQLGSAACGSAVFAVALTRVLPSGAEPGGNDRPEYLRYLMGLTRDEVAELLPAVSGGSRPVELVDSVWSETGGIPSLVTAIGHQLQHLDIKARAEAALTRADDARRGLDRVQEDIAAGVLSGVELARLAPAAQARLDTAVPGGVMCPYKGLASFARSDAALFCGRERLVATLVSKLAVNRFLAVIGPSGSGKSSLIAAGLIPSLAAGALPGSDRWPCLLIRPGADPMITLARAFAGLTGDPPPPLRPASDVDADLLEHLASGVLATRQPRGDRVVLIVDQFEELFTACQDPDSRAEFIRLLASRTAEGSAMSVAVVMRADYYGACAEHAELARLMGRSQMLVTPMTDAELRRVVLEPARRVGLTVEDGLAETIAEDAAAQAGALPLVSTALLGTWAARSGTTLTLAGYLTAGGVRGAVARLAETTWDGFDDAQGAACRRMLLRLADPDGVSSDVRRRATRTELVSGPTEETVLRTLIDRRLLTATEGTVEVAHEALLREWPRLVSWLEEDREGRRVHRQLADAAASWHADERDEAGLYRGVRLHAATDWAAAHPGDANPLETDFLAISQAVEERTVRRGVRTTRRLRALAAGLLVLLVAAAVAGVLALQQRSAARSQALQADTNRLATLASTLAGDQRDLALLLGAQAYQLRPSDDTTGGLQTALVQTPPGLDRVIRYHSASTLPHLDTTGHLLAVPGVDGTVTINDLATGHVLRTVTWPTPREFAVFSGDDQLIAAGGSDGDVAIWSLPTGQPSGQPLRDSSGGVVHAVFDPHDNARVYVISRHGLSIWDRHDPQHPRRVATLPGIGSDSANGNTPNLTISADGHLVAAGDILVGPLSGPARVWDSRTGKPRSSFTGSIGSFSSDGRTLPFGYGGDTVLVNAETGRVQVTVPNTGGASLAILSPDRRRIAVSEQVGAANVVVVYDLTTKQPVGAPLRLHSTAAYPIGFLPDGRLVTSGHTEAGIWTLGQQLPPIATEMETETGATTQGGLVGQAQKPIFLPRTTHTILTGSGFAGPFADPPQLHDTTTGRITGTLFNGAVQGLVAVSPNGRLIAGGSQAGGVGIWDLQTGSRIARLTGARYGNNLSWSPAGNLLAADIATAVQLWNVSDPSRPRLLIGIPSAKPAVMDYLLFSPDGRRLITAADSSGIISMINIAARRVTWSTTISDGTLRQVALSPDGNTLAVDSGDPNQGRLTLLDAATGTPRRSAPLQSYGGVAYLHRGQWLIITSDRTSPHAQLHDASTLQSIGAPFPTTDPYGDPVAVNNAGTMFSETDINPLLWNVDPAEWIRTACTIAGRNLTQAEWRQYLPARPYHSTCTQWPPGT